MFRAPPRPLVPAYRALPERTAAPARGGSSRRARAARWCASLGLCATLAASEPAEPLGPTWQTTKWQGEEAYVATSGGWRAIVSIERGRLIHLSPEGSAENVLFAPPTKDQPFGWGGHRVWLGPQAEWSNGWPPPPEWEKSAPAAVQLHAADTVLELAMPASGDGWPTFSRRYQWSGPRLICTVAVHDNGSRPVQVIQILQLPESAVVEARLAPVPEWPTGFVGLPSSARRQLQALETLPPHATQVEQTLQLRHRGEVEKLGFRPQPLLAIVNGFALHIGRGAEVGETLDVPDAGFTTHVYLGGPEPFIECEQLSARWRPQTQGVFEMVVEPLGSPE